MKKIYLKVLSLLLLVSCTGDFEEVVDFTKISNPNFSEGAVVGQPNSSSILLLGIERQMSIALNNIVVIAEIGSDNYVNTQTFYSQFMDKLDIRITDPDMRNAQFGISRLRELAKFGLSKVGPNDPTYTADIEAEYHFYEGMSYLMAGMYFSYLPQEPLESTVNSETNYNSAISSFNKAIAAKNVPEYHIAKARANYYLGNKTEAINDANQALALSSTVLKSARYDEKEGVGNRMESALYQRGTFDDLQPLPTLDFLDPKYSFLTANVDPSIHFLKAEEAHLILAEAAASSSDISSVKTNLTNLLTLIGTREIRNFSDAIEGRTQGAPGSRPDKASVIVNGRSGLVLDRQNGNISVPSVSGTSLTQSEIDNITTEDDALELIYRTRQEVFIGEGLRLVDMGVKLVLSEEEIQLNPNINSGDPGTSPTIPSFIDSIKTMLDEITYDATGPGVATTTIDLNKILVQNKTSNEVLPFN
ncbi:hypothetical protein ACQY1Q_16490 [Tenacibaculum sp. TC6]|uniref:hypothetical protein n=1 Tax=Tenacibaculum sp. TC6 TaxID=3423223 RepID=UPI003D36E6CA